MKKDTYFDIPAHVYAKGRPTYPAELYLWLSQQIGNQACVWDCGCGTGQVSVDLTAYFDQVEASDIRESQIAKATPHRKINYHVAPSEKTPYPDQYFDAVCVGQALHCFDLDVFWAEIKRILKPNGLFACWGYTGLNVSPEIDSIIKHQVLSVIHPHWPSRNKIIWNQYESVDFPLEMIEVPEFSLKFKWNANRMLDYIRTWSAFRALPEEESKQLIDEIWPEILQIWKDPDLKKDVSIPFFVKAGRLAS